MEKGYRQLSLEERCEIARLQADGASLRQIAAALDRSPSTISRELQRNRSKAGYKPAYAHQQSAALVGLAPRARDRAAPRRARPPRPRLVARTGRRPPRPRSRTAGDQP